MGLICSHEPRERPKDGGHACRGEISLMTSLRGDDLDWGDRVLRSHETLACHNATDAQTLGCRME
jgi:hypothetical protein